MVIIGNISFPQESANDVGKRFLELPPVPDFMTLKGPYIKGKKKDGIQALEIYELDKSKNIWFFGLPPDMIKDQLSYDRSAQLIF